MVYLSSSIGLADTYIEIVVIAIILPLCIFPRLVQNGRS